MIDHELDWITARRPDGPAPDPGAHDRALHALRGHIDVARAPRGLRRRSPRPSRFVSLAVGVGAAVAVVAVVLAAGGRTARHLAPRIATAPRITIHHRTGHARHAASAVHGTHSPLVQLAADVGASPTPTGDATLVQRTTKTGGQTITVYDLYADDGRYFFAPNESGLPAQVSAGNNTGDGVFAREVAAAKLAATGDVQTAAEKMAEAPAPDHKVTPATQAAPGALAMARKKSKLLGLAPPKTVGTLFDNYTWENSEDALIAGSGDPQVRAGVLRILAILPGVTVTQGTSDGQPTLVLTSGPQEVGDGYSEQLTLNADTGVPIEFTGGPPSGPPATTVDYSVSRVSLSNLPGSAGGQ